MSQSSCVNLQATRDFTTFQFQIGQGFDSVTWHVRFIRQKDTNMYEVILKRAGSSAINDLNHRVLDQPGRDEAEILLLILDVYAERYPNRVIYLKADTTAKAFFYRSLVEDNIVGLTKLFRIDFNPEMSSDENSQGIQYIGFLLSRKLVPYVNIASVETIWNGRSRLFNCKVAVVMEKAVRLTVAMPRKTDN